MALTLVVAACRFPATHHWPAAPAPVEYLRHDHRHEFHVRCWKAVTHDDRDVEIIQFKLAVEVELRSLATTRAHGHRDFGSMSCEMIARALLMRLGLERCEVLEDGENGAEVQA